MSPPSPFSMCSAEECQERLKFKEISQFEQTNGDMDPSKMVAKYRRSAAGTAPRTPRNRHQLASTISYLVQLLIKSSEDDGLHLVDLVQFAEDRFRAVQVDYTILGVQSCVSQHLIAKTHILLLYLLSDQSKQKGKLMYERKFSVTALQTALSAYWQGNVGSNEGRTFTARTTEMFCFSILTQLNEAVIGLESVVFSGTGDPPPLSNVWFHVVMLFRQHTSASDSNNDSLRWVMGLLSRISTGRWYCALQWLQKLDPSPFATLARCCVGGLVPILRWLVLQRFNRTLSKSQMIPIPEIARLLFFESTAQCGAFVAKCGLPCKGDSVEFKAVEISPPQGTFSRRSDSIVFGNKSFQSTMSRDGIIIPCPEVLRALLFSDAV